LKTGDTQYGFLKGMALPDYYENGVLRRCVLHEKNILCLPCGELVPQYKNDGKRKNLVKSITFYPSGKIASVVLQKISYVPTHLGKLPAEMITFHENGMIKRIFPTFGSINGFWTEEDERKISPQVKIVLPPVSFEKKVINISFYDSGTFESLTLWPKDTLIVHAPVGAIRSRIGFCFYKNGLLKSVEPCNPFEVNTPVGVIPAYDPDALGIDGKSNSLNFYEDGGIKSLVTSLAKVVVTDCDGRVHVNSPAYKSSDYFDGRQAVVPLKISFSNGFVGFGKRKSKRSDAEYKISEHSFKISTFNTHGCFNTCDECL
jgi:hypothetical protein